MAPIDTTAAAMAGVAAAAVTIGLFRAPLWGGILAGCAGALVTKLAIDNASATSSTASAAPTSSATPSG